MIQVVNRALDILEYLAKNKESKKGLGDIAGDLDLNVGTCANIIKTLINRKYIVKDAKRDYTLGPAAFALTGNNNYMKDLVEVANFELQKLTKIWNENTLIAVLNEGNRSVLAIQYANHQVQANTTTHKRAYNSATGRLLLAKLRHDDLEKFIHKYGLPNNNEWPEATTKKKLLAEVALINELGYAEQSTSNQIIGFAVPVFRNLIVIASISIYMPLYRFSSLKKEEVVLSLNKTAEAISAKL